MGREAATLYRIKLGVPSELTDLAATVGTDASEASPVVEIDVTVPHLATVTCEPLAVNVNVSDAAAPPVSVPVIVTVPDPVVPPNTVICI
jgi:hypothetical protein